MLRCVALCGYVVSRSCLSSQDLCYHPIELFFPGKVSEEVLTEEEQLNDLLLLIKLLTNLLSKDILNFGSGQ